MFHGIKSEGGIQGVKKVLPHMEKKGLVGSWNVGKPRNGKVRLQSVMLVEGQGRGVEWLATKPTQSARTTGGHTQVARAGSRGAYVALGARVLHTEQH